MTCDLHNHSTFSDGTQTPQELVAAAVSAGLSAVALTDHNTIAGLPEFIKACKEAKINAVPGIEFSTDSIYGELHILGLFIREDFYEKINSMLADVVERSDKSKRELVERIRLKGYDICYDEIRRKMGNISINRAHIAAELTAKGYTASIDDAFKQLLDKKLGLYVEPERLDALDVIKTIRSFGGVAVLAHPFLNLTENQLREFLPQAIPCGLDAMEVLYSNYDQPTTAKAVDIAREYGIYPSGGSDSHGLNKPKITIGVGMGNLSVPYEFYETLAALHKERCSAQ